MMISLIPESRLRPIVNSLINGQKKQMVELIDHEESYEFWSNIKDYLDGEFGELAYPYFADMVISYFKIKRICE